MSAPLKIYIAGPYTAATDEAIASNVRRAIDAALSIFAKGHFPYVPHLTHFIDQRARETGVEMAWEDYIRWDLPWISACDALLYLASSKGADLELAVAQELGKKTFHSVEEIPAVEPDALSHEEERVPAVVEGRDDSVRHAPSAHPGDGNDSGPHLRPRLSS
jgi:hypothetical protein